MNDRIRNSLQAIECGHVALTGRTGNSINGGNMLHELEDVLGSCVLASDGEIGNVHNALFDDRSWMAQ